MGPIGTSSLLAIELATALRTACEGKLPVKTRRNLNSIRANDDSVSHLDPSILVDQSKPKGKVKKIGGKDAASAAAFVPPAPTPPPSSSLAELVNVGRIVSCTWPSRHPLVQLLRAGRCDFVNVRDPIPYMRL